MRLFRQKPGEIEASLSPLDVSWIDPHAVKVIEALRSMPAKAEYGHQDVQDLLDSDFDTGLTVLRLFLDQAKDAFEPNLSQALGEPGLAKGFKVKRYQADKTRYIQALFEMGLAEKMREEVNRPLHWSDQLVERLKGGRGSATKGQRRGRDLEDFVHGIARSVFDESQIVARRRFTGADGQNTEKADFAIPSASDPRILIEVKAYGATGSKQTDVLGDVKRIVDNKRHDTLFLLVTDGVTWKQRTSDLRKLVELQNVGQIHRIYTKLMAGELKSDLEALRLECGL